MRSMVPLLLLALQCLDRVWALRCHNCSANAETCSGSAQCAPKFKACLNHKQTTVIQSQTVTSYSQVAKMCASSCQYPSPIHSTQQKVISFFEVNTHVSCCTTDLCNAAPSRGLGAATVGMMLLAPVLATLLGDFL